MTEQERLEDLQLEAKTAAERLALQTAAERAERELPGILERQSSEINNTARALRTCAHPAREAAIRKQLDGLREQHMLETMGVGQKIEAWASCRRAIEALRRMIPDSDKQTVQQLKRELGAIHTHPVQHKIDQLQTALKFTEGSTCPIVNLALAELGLPPAWRLDPNGQYSTAWIPSKQKALETELARAQSELAELLAKREELEHAIRILEDQLLPD